MLTESIQHLCRMLEHHIFLSEETRKIKLEELNRLVEERNTLDKTLEKK